MGPGRPEESLVGLLSEALRLHQEGDYGEAAARYRELLRHPSLEAGFRDKVLKGLGSSLLRAGEFPEAEATFSSLSRKNPQDPDLAVLHGYSLAALSRHGEAVPIFRRALLQDSRLANGWRGLARSLSALKEPEEALDAFRKLVEVEPQGAQNWYEMGLLHLQRKRFPEARQAFESCLKLDPVDRLGARVHLGRLCGPEDPAALPRDYVAAHFESFAKDFDAQLTGALQYRGPELLAESLAGIERPFPMRTVLDLGCGTGLCAAALPWKGLLIDGIDLSPAMIEKARQRGLYRKLYVGDLVAVMREKLRGPYDLAVAGDVLMYLGEPSELFAALRPLLRPGGLFAFTIETLPEPEGKGYRLRDTLRYQHDLSFVKARAEKGGFLLLQSRPGVLRTEGGEPVAGEVLVLESPRS